MSNFIGKFCDSVYQDIRGIINFLGMLTISAYFTSMIVCAVVYIGTRSGLEAEDYLFLVPYSGYWLFGNISIWFVLWIAKHVRKAMND
jgi:hypothetical protein